MSWVWIVIAVCVFDLFMTAFIVGYAVRRNWQPLLEPFPAREPRPDALGRRYQSFSVGILNLGWSVHVAADDGHLHLTPVRWMQRLGARPVSIPWDAIAITSRRPGGRIATVKIGALTMKGPAWCLDLADPEGRGDADAPAPPEAAGRPS